MTIEQSDAAVSQQAKRIAILALVLFAIPLLGWLTSIYVESQWDSGLRDVLMKDGLSAAEYSARNISYVKECSPGGVLASAADSGKICSGAEEIEYSRLASKITAGIGIGVVLLIFLAKAIAGSDRSRLGLVFSPMVRIVMLALAVSVVAQAGLLVYSIYTLEAAAIHRVHGGLLLIIGVGALFGAFQLLKSAFALLKVVNLPLRAELLPRGTNQELYRLVEDVARKLGAAAPDNIVIGLEPNFFVTVSPVQLLGESTIVKGRTLFISSALLRLLTLEELRAVIGHELGHFRGQDTEYSMKFAPIYSRLSGALEGMQTDDGARVLALLPAMALLSLCLNQFATVERTIGRERELLADKAGAEAASPEALASALVKVSLYASQWNSLTRHHIDELANGRYYSNLAEVYQSVCNNMFGDLVWEEAMPIFSTYVQPHPVDTHPPLGLRLKSLGVELENKDATMAQPAESSAISVLPSGPEIEERLTVLEIRWLEAIGAVVLPKGNGQ